MLNRFIDHLDVQMCRIGLRKGADWEGVRTSREPALYAGRLSRGEPQFRTHTGLTPFHPSSHNINHDLLMRLPLPGNVVNRFQSQDVFEHIEYSRLPAIIEEIFRVLRPGGLFRMSVPDYRNSVYAARARRDKDGNIIFDPHGGGRLHNGQVVDGGHVWFPLLETVSQLFEQSRFHDEGCVRYLHYNDVDGTSVLDVIDYTLGFIQRTPDHDPRSPGQALSIVVDAWKN